MSLRRLVRPLDFVPDPEEAYRALFARRSGSFWLDGEVFAPKGWGRSILGAAEGNAGILLRYRLAPQTLTLTTLGESRTEQVDDFLRYLDDVLQRSGRAIGGSDDATPETESASLVAVGYLGYEMKAQTCGRVGHRSPFPDAAFVLADRLLFLDHCGGRSLLVAIDDPPEASRWLNAAAARLAVLPRSQPGAREVTVAGVPDAGFDVWTDPGIRRRHERFEYLTRIARCQEEIRAGNAYEICLTTTVRAPKKTPALELFTHLRRVNPAPFSAFLDFPDAAVVSSSPELFLAVGPDGTVESAPIKGTRPRGRTAAEDRRLREELVCSEKDRAENVMIVDLVRHDLGRVCRIGSVHVPRLLAVETYPTAHHLVSTIRGELRPPYRAVDAVRAAFPPGSMTGAPKIRVMDILDELEGGPRGIYSGAVGWFSADRTAHLAVAIRTAVVGADGVHVGAGGAVTALSDPQAEVNEVHVKAAAVLGNLPACADQSKTSGSVRLRFNS
ncbi:MAG: aminodeoxychorismate synthase component I [Acidothermus sp.]|nr:aminodeoxychorismate synthase component I [Acidothermus sp.]